MHTTVDVPRDRSPVTIGTTPGRLDAPAEIRRRTSGTPKVDNGIRTRWEPVECSFGVVADGLQPIESRAPAEVTPSSTGTASSGSGRKVLSPVRPVPDRSRRS